VEARRTRGVTISVLFLAPVIEGKVACWRNRHTRLALSPTS
jgi:hypothetical protein